MLYNGPSDNGFNLGKETLHVLSRIGAIRIFFATR